MGGCRRDSQPAPLRFTHYRLRQRVSGALLNGGGHYQQFVFADVLRIDAGDLRLANRQRAGFIEGDMLNLAQLFQRRAALNQRPATCRCRQPRGNRRGRRDHQRARAANQQQGQPFINPALPRRAEEQRWNDGDQQGDQHDGGGVNPAEAVNKAFDWRAALLGLFNQLQDTVDGAVARLGQDFELHQAVDAGGTGRDFFACRTLNRNGFPGQGAFVKARGGGNESPIGRQTPARGDFNHVARSQRVDGDRFTFAFINPRGGFWLQRHQRAHPFARPARCPAFKAFAD